VKRFKLASVCIMGNLLPFGQKAEVEEDEEEDEDEDADDSEEERQASKAAVAKEKTKAAPKSRGPVPEAARPKNFAEIAAASGAKKKAPATVPKSAGAQFAALAAAKRASAQAAKKAAKASVPAQVSKDASKDEDLPRGGEGSSWRALRDSVVREDRDVKSSRRGVIQQGEYCTQTGPWRADPSGRVRMPVRGPRQLSGWVTLDARKCKLADGSGGTLDFEFMVEVEDHTTQEEAPQPQVAATARDDIDELLDIFGGDEPQNEPQGEPDIADDLDDDEPQPSQVEQEMGDDEVMDGAEVQAEVETSSAADAGAQRAASVLTEAQKRLRNIRKKLRELEAVQEHDPEDEAAMTDEQRARAAKRMELREKERLAAKEVAAEERAAAGTSGPRKRKKTKKTPSEQKAKKSSADGRVAKSRCGPTAILLVSFVALASIYYFLYL